MAQHFHPTAYEPLPVYQVEQSGSYIVTEAELERGYDDGIYSSVCIRGDYADVVSVYTGDTRIPLGVPLCGGCDSPLDLGVCRDCMVVYADAPDMSLVPVEFLSTTQVMA